MKCLKALLKRLKSFVFANQSQSSALGGRLGWKTMKPSPEGFIFWHLCNFTPRMDKTVIIRNFVDVFDGWQNRMDSIDPKGTRIKYRATSDYHKAHIRIFFVDPFIRFQDIDCVSGGVRTIYIPEKMDGPGGVLAYVPRDQHIIFFDSSENWSDMRTPKDGGISLFEVADHELGHIHDMDHSDEPGSIMNPYNDGTSKRFTRKNMMVFEEIYSPIKKQVR